MQWSLVRFIIGVEASSTRNVTRNSFILARRKSASSGLALLLLSPEL
jgi:hypothetical protein